MDKVMVSGIDSVNRANFPSQYTRYSDIRRPLHNFDLEDSAIISAQAKLLNELEKFNAGEGDVVDLALTCVMSEHEVAANANVINTKKEILDTLLEIMD